MSHPKYIGKWLISKLRNRSVSLNKQGDQLRLTGTACLTAEDLAFVAEHKAAILHELARENRIAMHNTPIATQLLKGMFTCRRCGSHRYRDHAIHKNRTIRRDCGECGAFNSFPVWGPHLQSEGGCP